MSVNYEKGSMGSAEMSDLIRAAKQQSMERSQEAKKKSMVVATTNTNSIINSSEDIKSAEHGSYVQTSDGVGAIVIDNELEAQKVRENDKTGRALLNLLNSDGLITDANQYIPDYGSDAPEGYDPGVQFIEENPYDPKTQELKKIKEGFANLSPGLPGHGLVDADSEESRLMAEAFHKLETGEIVLPTPEEYERQKEMAQKKSEQERADMRAKARDELKSQMAQNKAIPVLEDQHDDEPQMGEMPENYVMKKGVDELMNALENENTKSSQVENPVTTNTNEPIQYQQAPINLAEAEDALKEMNEDATPEPNEDVIQPNEVVSINVPAGEAEDFIESLPLETYDKLVTAKVVKVNQVELKDVPTANARVTDIADYKRLTRRRPKIKEAEITERVLVNSGFVITVKGATSLEMATLFKSPDTSEVDWEKEYTFCYEHTVGTSLGKLSYNEFVARVDPIDVETILAGIYEISETDTRKISINCGINDGGCGGSYEVDVNVASLPDLDDVTDDMKERIKSIVAAKGSVDETRRIVEESPTSTVKIVKIGDDEFIRLRPTTGNMIIERIDRIDEIRQTYGQLIAILILYVESITIQVVEKTGAEPASFIIDTTDLLCEELLHLNDEELQCIKDIITDDFNQYKTISYSIKGPLKCPHCGNVKKSIPCLISDLVFQKARRVLE